MVLDPLSKNADSQHCFTCLKLTQPKKAFQFFNHDYDSGRMGFAKSPAVTRIERKFRLLDPDTLEQEFKIKPKKKNQNRIDTDN